MRKVIMCSVWWLLVTIICGMIFMFSSEDAERSGDTSNVVVENIIDKCNINTETQNFKLDVIKKTRKIAHIIIFAALGFCAMGAADCTFKKASILIVLLCCFLYGCTDEIHQLFVEGRTGSITDVLIDTVGSAFGMGLFMIIKKVVSRRKS